MAAVEQTVLSGIAGAINRVLPFDPDTQAQLRTLAGKIIAIEIGEGDPPLRLFVCPTVTGIDLRASVERPADVTIAGSMAVFAQLWRRPVTAPVGQLHIRGDIELGQRFQRLLRRLDIDGEELVSRYVGDIAARQLGNLWRAGNHWARHVAATLGDDSAEYLREEARVVPSRERVREFLDAVDRLRADADRLEQRLQRLSGRD